MVAGADGLGIADATPLTATSTDHAVVFKGGKDFSTLVGKNVTLSLVLTPGKI